MMRCSNLFVTFVFFIFYYIIYSHCTSLDIHLALGVDLEKNYFSDLYTDTLPWDLVAFITFHSCSSLLSISLSLFPLNRDIPSSFLPKKWGIMWSYLIISSWVLKGSALFNILLRCFYTWSKCLRKELKWWTLWWTLRVGYIFCVCLR